MILPCCPNLLQESHCLPNPAKFNTPLATSKWPIKVRMNNGLHSFLIPFPQILLWNHQTLEFTPSHKVSRTSKNTLSGFSPTKGPSHLSVQETQQTIPEYIPVVLALYVFSRRATILTLSSLKRGRLLSVKYNSVSLVFQYKLSTQRIPILPLCNSQPHWTLPNKYSTFSL